MVGGVDHQGRGEIEGEVGGYVEVGHRGVDVGVDHAEEIEAHHTDDTKVAVAAVVVLARLHDTRQPDQVKVGFEGCRREEVHVGARGRVGVRQVAEGLGIVGILIVVPVSRVDKTHESSDYYREFPVAPVVDLPETRTEGGEPDGPRRIRIENLLPVKTVRGVGGDDDCLRFLLLGNQLLPRN